MKQLTIGSLCDGSGGGYPRLDGAVGEYLEVKD